MYKRQDLDYVGIKASQFSFNRLQKADPVLGVDMASTGEVGCIGSDTSCAILKSMLSVGYRIPKKNILLSTGTPKQKVDMLAAARMLQKKGYKIFATGGSSNFLTENGVENTRPVSYTHLRVLTSTWDRKSGWHPPKPSPDR